MSAELRKVLTDTRTECGETVKLLDTLIGKCETIKALLAEIGKPKA